MVFPVLIPVQNFLFPGTGRENLKCHGKGRDGKFEACIPGNHGKREFPLTPATKSKNNCSSFFQFFTQSTVFEIWPFKVEIPVRAIFSLYLQLLFNLINQDQKYMEPNSSAGGLAGNHDSYFSQTPPTMQCQCNLLRRRKMAKVQFMV